MSNDFSAKQENLKCCCIPDQNKLEEVCKMDANYYVIIHNENGPYTDTYSCLEHVSFMLTDAKVYTLVRIDNHE